MKHRFYQITWEVDLAGFCNITKENFLSINSLKNVAWKLVPGSFCFQNILCKMESEVLKILIFDVLKFC